MTERRQVSITAGCIALVFAMGMFDALARRDARDIFHRAAKLHADQRFEEALAVLETVPRRDALAVEADMLAGKSCFRLQHFAEAETYFLKAATHPAASPGIRMNLALSQYLQGKYDAASTSYAGVEEQAATTDPDLAERASLARQAIHNKRSIDRSSPTPGGR